MGDYGLSIASSGNDVLTQAIKDLKFTTKHGTLKLIKSGDISVTTNGSGDGTASVTHGFGFAPAYMAFQKCTAQWTLLDASSYANAYVPDPGTANQWGSDYHYTLHVYTDSTKIYLQAKGAAASTTYTIHYLLLMDLAETYTGADVSLAQNYGISVAKQGYDVRTAKQWQLAWSSRYKSIQYYDVSYQVVTLSLPQMWASTIDNPVEEGQYVDIAHGLGYPPFFMTFFRSVQVNNTISTLAPYVGLNGQDLFSYGVGGFCDATRVRLHFWRKSWYTTDTPSPKYNYDEDVVLKVYIFTEDLTQSFSAT